MKKMMVGGMVAVSMMLAGVGVSYAAGDAVYGAKCKMCHAADFKGNPAMKSMGEGLDLTKAKGDCVATVTTGKGKMPAVKSLTAAEVKEVCDYVKASAKP